MTQIAVKRFTKFDCQNDIEVNFVTTPLSTLNRSSLREINRVPHAENAELLSSERKNRAADNTPVHFRVGRKFGRLSGPLHTDGIEADYNAPPLVRQISA